MALYEYDCEKCQLVFEVVKSIKDWTRQETCSSCGGLAQQIFTSKVHFVGAKVEDAYRCPGLGTIVKSKKHRDQLAKQLGVVEIGNENPDKLSDRFEKDRAEKRKKSWEES